MYSYRIAGKTF